MPFPVAKLVYLAIKQVSKPLARVIKERAKRHSFLRNYILLRPAQAYHRFETTFKLRLMGFGRTKEVTPLNEEMAVELGAEMLGEITIFSVGALIIYAEYRRQARKEERKEDEQNFKLLELEQETQNLGLLVEEQSAHIRELTRLVHAYGLTGVPKQIVDKQSGTVLTVEKPS